ncbi:hypothetical protein, partial [Desulfovibrio sp.]|uniref:hypothetical protein n=1 Tax=Desulfovibrio sp. TaxID=885 RepID=UPI0030769BDD
MVRRNFYGIAVFCKMLLPVSGPGAANKKRRPGKAGYRAASKGAVTGTLFPATARFDGLKHQGLELVAEAAEHAVTGGVL